MELTATYDALRQRGWLVSEKPSHSFLLPSEIAARYPNIPPRLTAFLGGLQTCVDTKQTTWFLCESDFDGTGDSAFRWNEWEKLSLDSFEPNEAGLIGVRAFWDTHFPFLLSVEGSYSYCAIRAVPDGYGRVVYGREPEFEETDLVAEFFEAFLDKCCEGLLDMG